MNRLFSLLIFLLFTMQAFSKGDVTALDHRSFPGAEIRNFLWTSSGDEERNKWVKTNAGYRSATVFQLQVHPQEQGKMTPYACYSPLGNFESCSYFFRQHKGIAQYFVSRIIFPVHNFW
jgi:hypothetical protein